MTRWEEVAARVRERISARIVGMDDEIEKLLLCILTRQHALLVGVPGLAKTLLIRSLSELLDLSFARIQFTPDLMPSDITGTEVLAGDEAMAVVIARKLSVGETATCSVSNVVLRRSRCSSSPSPR